MANEIEKRNGAFLIYQDENGITRVNVRFEGEDVWLNLEQMMELFDASQQDVSYHINQIYAEGEQDPERTRKNFLIVRQDAHKVHFVSKNEGRWLTETDMEWVMTKKQAIQLLEEQKVRTVWDDEQEKWYFSIE